MKNCIILFCIIFFASCIKTNKLSQKDFEWMPYKGHETLVFKSNSGESDTIFLLKKDTLIAYPEAQAALNETKYEIVSVFCRHSDSWPPNGSHRYLESYFLELSKSKDNRTELNILLSAKKANFYRTKGFKVDSLSIQKPLFFHTNYNKYDDVYIIKDKDSLSFINRNDYIEKIYWSKSQGLIRYNNNDSVYWELSNKY